MDPLFWILAGVVGVCVIGIVVLWVMERRATRQLAAQQAEESANLTAVDPLNALEEIDTRPIPAASQPATQRTARKEFPAPLSSPYEHIPPGSRSPGRADRETPNRPEPPFAPIQVSRPPAAGQVWTGERPGASGAHRERPGYPSEPVPRPPESVPAAPHPAQESMAPAENSPAPQQEQLQTTPERAMLRAAELARERRSLEHLLEDNQARLDALLRGNALPDPEDASTVSLLQSEMAGQRERLQEIIFLEQNYRQVASPVTEQLAQQKRQAAPNAPGAFGVRRHPLARVQPPEQE